MPILFWLGDHGFDLFSTTKRVYSTSKRRSVITLYSAFYTIKLMLTTTHPNRCRLDPTIVLQIHRRHFSDFCKRAQLRGVYDVADECLRPCPLKGCIRLSYLSAGLWDENQCFYDINFENSSSRTWYDEKSSRSSRMLMSMILEWGLELNADEHNKLMRYFTSGALAIPHLCCSAYTGCSQRRSIDNPVKHKERA